MARPTHRIKAKDKTTGKYFEIGVIFKNEKGLTLDLKPGTKIQVVQEWSKEEKCEVRLDPPVVITKDKFWLNIFAEDDDEKPAPRSRKTFKPQPQGVDDDLPF